MKMNKTITFKFIKFTINLKILKQAHMREKNSSIIIFLIMNNIITFKLINFARKGIFNVHYIIITRVPTLQEI